MKTIIRNVFFAVLVATAFSCKNSSHDTDGTTDQGESVDMQTNDATNSTDANGGGSVSDTTSTGTLSGDNGADDSGSQSGSSQRTNSQGSGSQGSSSQGSGSQNNGSTGSQTGSNTNTGQPNSGGNTTTTP